MAAKEDNKEMGKRQGSLTNRAASHQANMSEEEHSVVSWLRCNAKVAASYGIINCGPSTRVGWMLMQMLAWMGASPKWKEIVDADSQKAKSGSVRAAAFVAGINVRSGRKPTPYPQPPMGAPLGAAIFRKNPTKRGRPPKISFSLLVRLARTKRKRLFSSRGNLVAAPGAVALVQVSAVVGSDFWC